MRTVMIEAGFTDVDNAMAENLVLIKSARMTTGLI